MGKIDANDMPPNAVSSKPKPKAMPKPMVKAEAMVTGLVDQAGPLLSTTDTDSLINYELS